MSWWQVLLSFVCGASCAVIVGMIVFYLWITKAFRFW